MGVKQAGWVVSRQFVRSETESGKDLTQPARREIRHRRGNILIGEAWYLVTIYAERGGTESGRAVHLSDFLAFSVM